MTYQIPKILLGTISVISDSDLIVFDLSLNNKLNMRIVDGDIFIINLVISNIYGFELLRIEENHVKHQTGEPLSYLRRPGKIRITSPVSEEFLQKWALNQFRFQEPDYANDGELILLDIEVLEPGLVQVQGIWPESDFVLIISKQRVSFITPGMREPVSICGAGVNTVLRFKGPINKSLFHFK